MRIRATVALYKKMNIPILMITMTVMIMMVIIIRIKGMATSADTINILTIVVMTVRRSDHEVTHSSYLPFHFGHSQQSRGEEQRQER